jgi:hypothetical protein
MCDVYPFEVCLFLPQVLFHAAFLERAKAIITDCLQDAAGAIYDPLRLALKAAATHTPEPAGQLQPGNWPSILGHSTAPHTQGIVQLDRTYTALGGRTSSVAWSVVPQSLAYSRSGALMGTLSGLVAAAEEDPAGECCSLKLALMHFVWAKGRMHARMGTLSGLVAAAEEDPAW